MSRDYSIVTDGIWTGNTGQFLAQQRPEMWAVAFYLFTGPQSNMLGLYYLSIGGMSDHTGFTREVCVECMSALSGTAAEGPSKDLRSPFEGPSKPLRRVIAPSFLHWNGAKNAVFIPSMAAIQMQGRVSVKDNRHKAILKELEKQCKHPFFNDFLERYMELFSLHTVLQQKDLRSPFEGPSKDLRRTYDPVRSYDLDSSDLDSDLNLRNINPADCSVIQCSEEPDDFAFIESLKADYPQGTYRRSEWLTAERLVRKALAERIATKLELQAGVKRYYAQMAALTKIGTQYVMSPVKFFDHDARNWQEEFPIPPSAAEIREREALQKLHDRREAIGIADFRDALPGETSADYAKAQDAAWQASKRSSAPSDNRFATVVSTLATSKSAVKS